MGSVEADRGFPAYLLGLHTATAVAVWVAMVIQVIMVGLAGRSKEAEAEDVAAIPVRRAAGLVKDFLMLTKPVVGALLLVTTFAGMVVGAASWPTFELVFWTLLAGAMAAGGSGAINQYIDRLMIQRCSVLPADQSVWRMTPGEGLAFGVMLAIGSFYLMVAYVNFLAALLSLAGIIYYVLLYSIILKKTTVQILLSVGSRSDPTPGWLGSCDR